MSFSSKYHFEDNQFPQLKNVRPSSKLFSALLMGSVAVGVLMMAQPDVANAGPDGCAIVGVTAICTGDQSGGITNQGGAPDFITPAVTTLNVNNLTDDIDPGAGSGIRFDDNDALTDVIIDVNTGTFAINTAGIGIDVDEDNTGDLAITSVANITSSTDDGIEAFEQDDGALTINSTGNITAVGQAIDADETGLGNLSITSEGDLVSSDDTAISASESGDGNITIESTGTVTGDDDGILANETEAGDVTITSSGNVTATKDQGFDISEANDGNLTINSTGNVTAENEGFDLFENGDGNLSLTTNGTIRSEEGDGIEADEADDGNLTINSTGAITADDSGINATETGVGDLTITSDGFIVAAEHGISAVEAGAGNLTITTSNNVVSTGNDVHAIRVVTDAGSTATLNISDGFIRGGDATGAGIHFEDVVGTTNILNLSGNVAIASVGGIAINDGVGNTTINNSGTLSTTQGSINLGGGVNAFNNNAGAVFSSGEVVNLGAGNLFTNDGTLSAGGDNAVVTTTLTGNYVQSATGVLNVSVDRAADSADRINVSGTAAVAGTVVVNLTGLAIGEQQHTILSATGGLTNNGLELQALNPLLRASLLYPNANDVVLSTNLDFASPDAGLNKNQISLARNLNKITTDTGGGGAVIQALVNGITDIPSYVDALDQLLPEAYLNTETATLFAAEEFTGDFFSCAQRNNAIKEGECHWTKLKGRTIERDSTGSNVGYDENIYGLSAGMQVSLGNNWFAGVGFGYEKSSLETNTKASSDADRFQFGTSLKHQSGSFLMAGAVTAGFGNYETERSINFGGFSGKTEASHNSDYIAGQMRAAYLLEAGRAYFKPIVDLNVSHVSRDEVTETGGGAANLIINAGDQTYYSITPSIEVGTNITLDSGMKLQPFAKAGVSLYEGDTALTARFDGLPGGAGYDFSIKSDFDTVFADIEAGIKIFDSADDFSFAFSYEGRFADDTAQHAGLLKGTLKLDNITSGF